MSEDVRILVVDDHTLFRRGLVGLLAEMEGFEVVGEAANGQDALYIDRSAKTRYCLTGCQHARDERR